MKNLIYITVLTLVITVGCSNSKKLKERQLAKYEQTKTQLNQQKKAITYFDSLLLALSHKADSLLPYFKYTKDEKYLNNGFYIHKNLQTNINYLRNFIQVRLTDNYDLIVKSYYIGSYPLQASSFIISDDSTFLKCSGSLHAFKEDNYHEILTPNHEDAKALLIFLDEHFKEKLYIEIQGTKKKCKYYINKQDKEALQCSHQLYVTMQDIHKLEKERTKSSKLIELYSKRLYKDSVVAFGKK